MVKKKINNELYLIKIRNYENNLFSFLINTSVIKEEIYNTINLIERGCLDPSYLIKPSDVARSLSEKRMFKKMYEIFRDRFLELYKKYKELDVIDENINSFKENCKTKKEVLLELKKLLYSVMFDKKFIYKIIDKYKHIKLIRENTIYIIRKINAYKKLLISDNMGLSHKVVIKYHITQDYQDYINTGMQGIIRAMNMFDVSKGLKFSTYATYWIDNYVKDLIATQRKLVKAPTYLLKKLSKLNKFKHDFIEKYNRKPTEEELASLLKCDITMLQELEELDKINMVSIHYKSEETELLEMIGIEDYNIESLENDEFKNILSEKIEQLEKPYQDVLNFMLNSSITRKKKFDETLERTALDKLKSLIQLDDIRGYL